MTTEYNSNIFKLFMQSMLRFIGDLKKKFRNFEVREE